LWANPEQAGRAHQARPEARYAFLMPRGQGTCEMLQLGPLIEP